MGLAELRSVKRERVKARRSKSFQSWQGKVTSSGRMKSIIADSAFSSAIYPGGEHAIAFINDARFMISTLHIVDGQIVRADYTVGNPPVIRPDDVNTYLIAPGE
jgi:hypothetical protein